MKTFTISNDTQISLALLHRKFDELTKEDWEVVILNILEDEENENAGRPGQRQTPLPIRPPNVSHLHVSTILKTSNRDTTPLVGAVGLFDKTLSLKARKVFCSAISSLVLAHYIQYKKGNLSVFVLETLLKFSRHFTTSLDPIVAEQILFDKVMGDSLRIDAGFHLIHGRSFCATPTDKFWEDLSVFFSASPELVALPMHVYWKRGNPVKALCVLKKIELTEKIASPGFISMCQQIITEILRFHKDGNHVRELIESFSPETQKFFKDHQIIQIT